MAERDPKDERWKIRLLQALARMAPENALRYDWAVQFYEDLDRTGWRSARQPETAPEPLAATATAREPEPVPIVESVAATSPAASVPPTPKKRGRKKGKKRPRPRNCHEILGIELLALDPCAYCGDPLPTTHDHIEPLSRGGSHELENLAKACRRCNFEKTTRPLLQFLAYRALKRAGMVQISLKSGAFETRVA